MSSFFIVANRTGDIVLEHSKLSLDREVVIFGNLSLYRVVVVVENISIEKTSSFFRKVTNCFSISVFVRISIISSMSGIKFTTTQLVTTFSDKADIYLYMFHL